MNGVQDIDWLAVTPPLVLAGAAIIVLLGDAFAGPPRSRAQAHLPAVLTVAAVVGAGAAAVSVAAAAVSVATGAVSVGIGSVIAGSVAMSVAGASAVLSAQAERARAARAGTINFFITETPGWTQESTYQTCQGSATICSNYSSVLTKTVSPTSANRTNGAHAASNGG